MFDLLCRLLPAIEFRKTSADRVPRALGEAGAVPKEPLRGTTNSFLLIGETNPAGAGQAGSKPSVVRS